MYSVTLNKEASYLKTKQKWRTISWNVAQVKYSHILVFLKDSKNKWIII